MTKKLYVLVGLNISHDGYTSAYVNIISVYTQKELADQALANKLNSSPTRPDGLPCYELQVFTDGGKRIYE